MLGLSAAIGLGTPSKFSDRPLYLSLPLLPLISLFPRFSTDFPTSLVSQFLAPIRNSRRTERPGSIERFVSSRD